MQEYNDMVDVSARWAMQFTPFHCCSYAKLSLVLLVPVHIKHDAAAAPSTMLFSIMPSQDTNEEAFCYLSYLQRCHLVSKL